MKLIFEQPRNAGALMTVWEKNMRYLSNFATFAVTAVLSQTCLVPALAQINPDSTKPRFGGTLARHTLEEIFETGRVDHVVIAKIEQWEDLRPQLPNLTFGTDTPMPSFDYHIELTDIQVLFEESTTDPVYLVAARLKLPLWVGGCFPARLGKPTPPHLPINEKRIFPVSGKILSPDKTFHTAHCTGRILPLSALPEIKRILQNSKKQSQ